MTPEPAATTPPSLPARIAWTSLGIVAIGIGGVGIIVPGLPTTVFFILAAWAFSKSSPRLEAWVLDLPKIGPLVRDYRAGLGMPRRAKVSACVMMVVFVALSVWLLNSWIARGVILVAMVIGAYVVLVAVPTKAEA